jgi:hypothetical protein
MWSTSRPGHFTSVKQRRFQLNRRLGGSQRRSERPGEQKNVLPLQGIESLIFQPVVLSPYRPRNPGSLTPVRAGIFSLRHHVTGRLYPPGHIGGTHFC